MTLEIYRADTSHLGALVPLFDAYRVFYRQPSDPGAARAFLAARLTRQDTVILLANLDGPVGFTQLFPSFSSVSAKRLWILNDLFVKPEARRGGVAKALLESARQHALDTHAKGLVLSTEVDNRSAQHLYEALGWQRNETFYTYGLEV